MSSVIAGSTSLVALGSVQVLSLPNNRIQVRHYRKKCNPVSEPPQALTRRVASIADHSDEALAQLEAEGERTRDASEGFLHGSDRFSLCRPPWEGLRHAELRLSDAPLSADLLQPQEAAPPPFAERGLGRRVRDQVVGCLLPGVTLITQRGTAIVQTVRLFTQARERLGSRGAVTTVSSSCS